jgi:cytoskeletal protein RodZ
MTEEPRDRNAPTEASAGAPAEASREGGTLPFDGKPSGVERFTTVGEELRRERELREITLQEISEETKISIRNLKAIEENEFDLLPGGIYTKNFIRAYCRYLGISDEKMVNHYLYQTSPRQEPAPRMEEPGKEGPWSGRMLGAVIILAVVAAATAGLVWAVIKHPEWFGFQEGPVSVNSPVAPTTAAVQGPPRPLDFHFLARNDTWIRVSVDGEARVVRMLKRGEYFDVTAHREVVLGVDDAGALEWKINGRPARPLGAEGEVVSDLKVGHHNWRNLLQQEE